jgi:hypothetical protein
MRDSNRVVQGGATVTGVKPGVDNSGRVELYVSAEGHLLAFVGGLGLRASQKNMLLLQVCS